MHVRVGRVEHVFEAERRAAGERGGVWCVPCESLLGPFDVARAAFRAAKKRNVGALIFDRGRILMAQRGKEPLKGWWSLPGGAVDAIGQRKARSGR